jgi:hypothetical protein
MADEVTLVQTDGAQYLNELGLKPCASFGVPICLGHICECAVRPKQIRAHFKNKHPKKTIDYRKLQDALEESTVHEYNETLVSLYLTPNLNLILLPLKIKAPLNVIPNGNLRGFLISRFGMGIAASPAASASKRNHPLNNIKG